MSSGIEEDQPKMAWYGLDVVLSIISGGDFGPNRPIDTIDGNMAEGRKSQI